MWKGGLGTDRKTHKATFSCPRVRMSSNLDDAHDSAVFGREGPKLRPSRPGLHHSLRGDGSSCHSIVVWCLEIGIILYRIWAVPRSVEPTAMSGLHERLRHS